MFDRQGTCLCGLVTVMLSEDLIEENDNCHISIQKKTSKSKQSVKREVGVKRLEFSEDNLSSMSLHPRFLWLVHGL